MNASGRGTLKQEHSDLDMEAKVGFVLREEPGGVGYGAFTFEEGDPGFRDGQATLVYGDRVVEIRIDVHRQQSRAVPSGCFSIP
jgi:hypothetical protein